MSFNAAPLGRDPVWTLSNWITAWTDPGALSSLWNTILIYLFNTIIGFPIAIMVSWALARTKVRFSHGLEFMFWVSFMLPTISTTVGWTFLLDPDSGLLNVGLSYLGIGAFNIYSVPGIVFAHLMSSQISQGVMLLTPAFRNMDSALEEAARMSGASTMRTMLRVTLPLMMPPILVVFMLKMARIIGFTSRPNTASPPRLPASRFWWWSLSSSRSASCWDGVSTPPSPGSTNQE